MKKAGIVLSLITVILIYISFLSLGGSPFDLIKNRSVPANSIINFDGAEQRAKDESLIEQRVEAESVIASQYNEEHLEKMFVLVVKFLFSLILGCCALYVVLSKKYDQDTQKWAFSVLSLISGVWIGTVS